MKDSSGIPHSAICDLLHGLGHDLDVSVEVDPAPCNPSYLQLH